VVFPVKHHRRGIAASRKIGHGQGLIHTLDSNLLLADDEVWPSIESKFAELVDPALFH
jgi:hypothetical protein